MKVNDNLKFDSIDYQNWYSEEDITQYISTGLMLGLAFFSFYILFGSSIYPLLEFGVSFLDPSTAFAEHLIHLYNIVWIILLFVVFFILVLLIRIIYLFNWKFFYFSSSLYTIGIKIVLEFFLILSIQYNHEVTINAILKRLNLIETGTSGFNTVGLNLWYNKDSGAFLTISEISEYRILEVVWCLLPIGSLLFISTPTFSLIFSLDAYVDPVYTIKIIGHQWYWTYEINGHANNMTESQLYPFNEWVKETKTLVDPNWNPLGKDIVEIMGETTKNISIADYEKYKLERYPHILDIKVEYDSCLVSDEDLIEGSHRLLEVDHRLFLPVGIPIRLLITSEDVLHSWAVPSLGVKVDAVPGRLNQFIVEVKRPGVFYGQCSELCGPYHGFMPIVIQAINPDAYENWLLKRTHSDRW